MSMKPKSGLHKEISSIFSGVPLPANNADGNATKNEDTTDKTAGHIPPKPLVPPKPPQITQKEPEKQITKTEKGITKPEKEIKKPGKQIKEPEKKIKEPEKQIKEPEKQIKEPENQIKKPEETPVPVQQQTLQETVQKKTRLSGLRKSLNPLLQQFKEKLLTPPEGVSPTKHMATVVSVPILCLVAMIVLGRLVLKSGMKGSKGQGDDLSIVSIKPKTEPEWHRPSVYPVGLRDPMKKAYEQGYATVETTDVEVAEVTDIVIRGIVWSDDSAAAIIGTEIVYQGQTIHGVTVIKIEKDSVELERDGKRWIQKVSN